SLCRSPEGPHSPSAAPGRPGSTGCASPRDSQRSAVPALLGLDVPDPPGQSPTTSCWTSTWGARSPTSGLTGGSPPTSPCSTVNSSLFSPLLGRFVLVQLRRAVVDSRQRGILVMCLQHSRARLSPDEQLTAEKSFALYCKPVELYNIIQRRAVKNPLFIQRSLLYKIQARRKKRIQLTISLSGSTNTQAQNIFPLYVLLARPTSNLTLEGHSPIYRFSRICSLTSFSEFENKDRTEATFIIPDLKTLSTSRACNLNIIFISCGTVCILREYLFFLLIR
ncbi:unnamed protein product, partial [Urochloa humidicola]